MKLLYPRYCVLDMQQQLVVACLRLQDLEGPAHKEVRTFGSELSDVVVLSNWLASHGVTHVAIKASTGSWKPLYQALQQAFTLPLPALERTPEKVPVKVMLEPSMATASWLQFDRERLQMQGTAPLTAAGQTYQLMVRAQAEHGSESRLQVALTITGQPQPPPSAADSPPPSPPPSPQPQSPDRPSDASGTMKIWHFW